MNKKGFTLVELIGVIILLGILLLITIPAISGIIFESKEGVYANNISSMITNVETLYQEKRLGSLLDENQIMIFPIKNIEFDRNDNSRSPFDEYDFYKSYIIIEKTKHSFKSYATVIDKSNRGILEAESSNIKAEYMVEQDPSKFTNIRDYYVCDIDFYDFLDNVFVFKDEEYIPVEARAFENNLCSDDVYPDKYPILIFEKR